jgi:hypothetical protein
MLIVDLKNVTTIGQEEPLKCGARRFIFQATRFAMTPRFPRKRF